jgi:hypothetical protein
MKETLRVSFLEHEDDAFQSEIVCLVRSYDNGLEINYVYHVHRSREIPSAPWEEKRHRVPLSPIVAAIIQSGVMHELWSKFCMKVVAAPSDLLTKLYPDQRSGKKPHV